MQETVHSSAAWPVALVSAPPSGNADRSEAGPSEQGPIVLLYCHTANCNDTLSCNMQQFKYRNQAGYDGAANQESDRRNDTIERSHKMLAGNNEAQRTSRRPRNKQRKDVTIQTSV